MADCGATTVAFIDHSFAQFDRLDMTPVVAIPVLSLLLMADLYLAAPLHISCTLLFAIEIPMSNF